MRSVVLYLHVHQPWRVRPYTVFDTATHHDYFSDRDWESINNNREVFRKVAEKSYLPTNRLLLDLLREHPQFRLSLSITGTVLEQCEAWGHDVLDSFRELIATGRVEIVAETYHHSLAFFYSRDEFERQVTAHRELIRDLFSVEMTAFRNTELAYNNDLASWADQAGYEVVLAEGWDPVLGWRSPNFVYRPVGTDNIKLLMKNYRLSDDIAFRFGNRGWSQWPLTPQKYLSWLDSAMNPDHPVVNLFMDYETFGEHQWADTGIFEFMRGWIGEWLLRPGHGFATVSEAAKSYPVSDTIDVPYTVTWADSERDLTAWLGNKMQQEALRHLYDLKEAVLATGDGALISDWRKLQTSDHVYFMCTKWFNDGDVHAYFSPYDSPYDAFLYFMNALRDIRWRVLGHQKGDFQIHA